MGNLMRKWMTKASAVAASEPETETSAAELDVMANEEGAGLTITDPVIHNGLVPGFLMTGVTVVTITQPHPLDDAPVNSKLVVVKSSDPANPGRYAVLMTPNGEQKLEADDPAHKLAEGARIQKRGEGKFVSVQLSPADDRDPLETTTAAEAIARFNQHFHDVQP